MYQRTVLIVEDEILIRMMLADTLFDEGYDVIEAANRPPIWNSPAAGHAGL